MACGENPKRVYGRSKQMMPASRMGSAWLMRETFEAARNLIAEQDTFDCTWQPAQAKRPEKLELLPLTYLLRRHPNITLHIHCYETQDIEMLFRLSDEFGFKIDTLQHALEAYKMGDKLRQRNITVATFADMFGFKTEAYESSVTGAPLLERAGVNIVLKSDHPVTHAHWLLSSAAKAHYYGMTAGGAIDAVTINPARGLRLGHRIGALKPGYDADIAIFDRHPLLMGARADKVFIDGQLLVDKNLALKNDKTVLYAPNSPIQILKATGGECKNRKVYNSYAIDNAKIITMNGDPISNGKVVVTNGKIECIGTCTIPNDAVVFSVKNGVVTPGLIESATDLGLVDISSESVTYDGYDGNSDTYARDAIRMESRTMQAAFRSGVTTSVTHRQGSNLVNGQSVAFHTLGRFISESLIQDSVAYQVSFGAYAKDNSGSISAQRRSLYNWIRNLPASHDIKTHKKPIVVQSHQADDIDQLLTMQDQLNFTMIILGGAEAHLHADRLVGRDVHVVLTPISEDEGYYMSWDTRRTSFDFGASVLAQKGVSFGIATGNSAHEVRNLRWTAGLVSAEGIGDTAFDALAAVTSKIADMYNLPFGVGRLVVGTQANFVLFEGNPLSFEGRPKLVAVGDCLECGDQLNQF
jgi:imidazolonepropionase-like amidohydrolase